MPPQSYHFQFRDTVSTNLDKIWKLIEFSHEVFAEVMNCYVYICLKNLKIINLQYFTQFSGRVHICQKLHSAEKAMVTETDWCKTTQLQTTNRPWLGLFRHSLNDPKVETKGEHFLLTADGDYTITIPSQCLTFPQTFDFFCKKDKVDNFIKY